MNKAIMRNLLIFFLTLFTASSINASAFGQITLPWVQDFEAVTNASYTVNTNPLPGLPASTDESWAFEKTNAGMLLAGQSQIESFCDASSLGHLVLTCSAAATDSRGDIIVTLDMSNYDAATDNVELSLDYLAGGQETNFLQDGVFIRGNNLVGTPWLRAIDFSLESNVVSNFACHPIQRYKVSELLASQGQNYSTTFQIRLGYRDEETSVPSGSPPYSTFIDQLLFDNMRLDLSPTCKGCHFTVTSFPYQEDFDLDVTFNDPAPNCFSYFPFQSYHPWRPAAWHNEYFADDQDWIARQDPTTTSNTGPSAPFSEDTYLYLESSSNGCFSTVFPGPFLFEHEAIVHGPCFDATGMSAPAALFYNHMYGADMGELNFEVSIDGGCTWNTEWTQSGDQGDIWNCETVDLSAYAGNIIQVRFRGVMGQGPPGAEVLSDMAIDEFRFGEAADISPPNCDLCGLQLSGTYTVHPITGDFPTIQCAIDALEARGINGPVEVFVVPGSGPYNEAPRISQTISGTNNSTDRVVFNGNGNTIVFPLDATTDHVFGIADADDVTLRDFVIDASTGAPGISNGVRLTDDADDVYIENCTIIGKPGLSGTGEDITGVYVDMTTRRIIGTKVLNNTIENNAVGVHIRGDGLNTNNCAVRGNTILGMGSMGVFIEDDRRDTVVANTIEVVGTGTGDLFGVRYFDGGSNATVEGNNITITGAPGNSLAYGISMDRIQASSFAGSSNRHLLANNAIKIFGTATGMYGLHFIQDVHPLADVYHNSTLIQPDNLAMTNTASLFVDNLANVVTRIDVINNNFVNLSAGHGIRLDGTSTAAAQNGLRDVDFNNIYVPSGNVGQINGVNSNTLANWQATAISPDANSFSEDPLFVSPTDLNIDNENLVAGTDLTGDVPVDIQDSTRAVPPTIGAYEYIDCVIGAGAMAGNYTIDPVAGDFKTIQCAMNNVLARGVSAAVTFEVVAGSGPYEEAPRMVGEIAGASATNTITFDGNGETVFFALDATTDHLIGVTNTDFVTFTDFDLDASTGTVGFCGGIWFDDGATNCVIENSTITGNAGTLAPTASNSLVFVDGRTSGNACENIRLHNNELVQSARGIFISGVLTAGEAVITNNQLTAITTHGIFIDDSYRPVVEGNTIEITGVNTENHFGIFFRDVKDGFSIQNNRITVEAFTGTNFSWGIRTRNSEGTPGNPNLIANNFVILNGFGNRVYGMRIERASNPSLHTNAYHNSILVNNSATPANISAAIATLNQRNNSAEIELRNNIFADLNASGIGIFLDANNGGGKTSRANLGLTSSDHNAFHVPSGNVAERFNLVYASLTDWQVGGTMSPDANAIVVDPIFTSGTDLHVAETALQAGEVLATVTLDIDGQLRGNTLANPPTIGADEIIDCAIGAGTMSGTFTVDAAGTGDYLTVQCACDNLVARGVSGAVTINIEPGTYNEYVVLMDVAGTSPTNRVTFRSSTGDSTDVVVQYATQLLPNPDIHVWAIEDADYITLQNLTLENIGSGSARAVLRVEPNVGNSVDGFELIGCQIITEPNPTGTTQNKIGVRFYNNQGTGINNSRIERNYFDGGTSGFYTVVTTFRSTGLEVLNNTFVNTGGFAAIAARSMNDINIRNNRVVKTSTSTWPLVNIDDVGLNSSSQNVVANNMIVENGSGFNAEMIQVRRTENLGVYYNSVNINNGGTGATCLRVFDDTPVNANIDIRNNAFVHNGTGDIAEIERATDVSQFNFNNLWHTGTGNLVEVDVPNVTYANLAAVQSNPNWTSTNTVGVTPGFASPTVLYLTASSLMIDEAVGLTAVTTDIDGDLRNPDIGADEFIPPLPIELIGFNATATDEQDVIVRWTTASEINSSHFELERRTESGFFEQVTTTTALGKSSSVTAYDYLDAQPPKGRLFYRLKSVDLDGTSGYSRVVNVLLSEDGKVIMTAYPNPTNDALTLKIAGAKNDSPVQIELYDMLGKLVKRQAANHRQAQAIGLSLTDLTAGVYTLKVTVADTQLLDRIIKR